VGEALARHTTLGLGGPAREFVVAATERELIDAVGEADAMGMAVLVLGGGSNLVVADEGFDGRVVRVATRGLSFTPDGDRVRVEASAGEVWDELVARVVASELAGVECLSGIPGLVGATPIQNVGAYGQEVADTIVAVRLYDRVARAVVTFDLAACGFAYRDSVFKSREPGRYVVLGVTFALKPGGAPAVRYGELSRALAERSDAPPSLGAVRETVIALRRSKGMVFDPGDSESQSAGSFFMNPIVETALADAVEARARARGALREGESMPRFNAGEEKVKLAAGWLIERAGVAKGTRRGPVAVSRKHALALVHHGGGTTRELLALAGDVRDAVRAAFGVEIAPEPVLVGCGFPR
jgi:UDP-N-acetylmuramate dehydrogenase